MPGNPPPRRLSGLTKLARRYRTRLRRLVWRTAIPPAVLHHLPRMASEDSELLYESILLRSRYHRGWRGLLLVLCVRNPPLLGQMRLQAPLVCHRELPRLDQRIVSGGERVEFVGRHFGEMLRAGGAGNVAVQ